jgi:hypothetical protein
MSTVGTDVYDTVAAADTYWTARGNETWLDSDDKEVYLIKATDWLDRNFTWRGTRLTEAQRLGWPRADAYDDDEYQIGLTEAPWQVKEAMFIVADLFRDGTYDLTGVLTSNNRSLKRQKVDVIEVEYDPGSRLPGADVVTHVIKLLRPVMLTSGEGRLLRV